MFRRRSKIVWWVRPFMFIGIVMGLIMSEKNAPMITKNMTMSWWIDVALELKKRIQNVMNASSNKSISS
jgi:hypothetical protein